MANAQDLGAGPSDGRSHASGKGRAPAASSRTPSPVALTRSPFDASVRPLKLVLLPGEQPWQGSLYPTQKNRGRKFTFSSPEELVAAVARLLGWSGDD